VPLLPPILLLRGFLRLPLHITRIVGAAPLKRHDVVDHVAGAGARGLPGGGAWVVVLEAQPGRLAPLDPAVAVGRDADCRAGRVVAGE